MTFTRLTAALFALMLAAVPASAEVYDWSQTPASNNTSDTASDVQWSEGMSPSDVNDSARAMMAEIRKFLDDLGANNGGAMQTSAGSSTAYTLATQGSADNLENGRMVCFIVDEANGADPTMNVDSLGPKHIFIADGTTLVGGEMVANTVQCLSYDAAANSAAGGWMMRNRFITVEAGGGLETDGVTGALQRSALTGDVTASAGSNATTIANNAVSYAKMQDVSATDRFIGRDTAGSGDPEEITPTNAFLMTYGADPNNDRIAFWDDSAGAPAYLAPNASLAISTTTFSVADADFGDIVTSSSGTSWVVDSNAVALATDTTGNYVSTVADGTGIDGTCSSEDCTYTPTLDLTEKSSATWGSGSAVTLTYDAGAVDPVETFGSGTVTWSATTAFELDDEASFRLYEEDANGSNYFALVAPNALSGNVTCTIDSNGRIPDSCVGDGVDGSGSGGDEFGTDADRGDATVSSSGAVITIDNDVVTHAKYQNISTDSLIGRDTAGTGDPEELSVGGGVEFTGSGGIQRSALTGDVTAPAGSNVTTIGSNTVALGTDTTGNYVATVADGTGIDGTASGEGTTYTPTLDLTEVSSATWGAGSFTSFTFDAGVVDPVLTFGSGTLTFSAITTLNLDDEGEFRLFEEDGGGSNYVGFKAPAALTSSVTCTFENDSSPIPDSCVGDGSDADTLGSDGDKGDITVGGSGTTLTIDADSLALGTDTTGNYAAGDAEAGAALTGDSATAFFSTGTIEDARIDGSAEADEVLNSDKGDFTCTTGTCTNDANSIALTTDTTGNYAAGDAEAGAALTGDSATAFFSTGTIETARLPGEAVITQAATQATTSGTAFNFTSLPSTIKRITVMFDQVSLSGTDDFLIQLGDSGGVENTGYVSTSANLINSNTINTTSSTAGCVVTGNSSASSWTGAVTFTNLTGSTWIASGTTANNTSTAVTVMCSKATSATTDRLTITRSGTNTFDAGQVGIAYE